MCHLPHFEGKCHILGESALNITGLSKNNSKASEIQCKESAPLMNGTKSERLRGIQYLNCTELF